MNMINMIHLDFGNPIVYYPLHPNTRDSFSQTVVFVCKIQTVKIDPNYTSFFFFWWGFLKEMEGDPIKMKPREDGK